MLLLVRTIKIKLLLMARETKSLVLFSSYTEYSQIVMQLGKYDTHLSILICCVMAYCIFKFIDSLTAYVEIMSGRLYNSTNTYCNSIRIPRYICMCKYHEECGWHCNLSILLGT